MNPVELWTGFRHRVSALWRRPGVTTLAIATMALGIGATTALFSVLHTVLIEPLPYAEPDRLVAALQAEPERGATRLPTSPLFYFYWKEQSRLLEEMTAATPWSPTLTGRGQPDKLDGLRADSGLFRLLGQTAVIGSVFDPSQIAAGETRVIVLGHSLWTRKFGSDPQIVGQILTLDGEPFQVVGITPPGFRFPPFWATEAEFWSPLVVPPEDRQRDARFLRVFARLAPGATLEQAQRELDRLTAAVVEQFSLTGPSLRASLEPLHEPVVSEVRPALVILLAAVGVVLIIACANVANLLLVRGVHRQKEMALKMALGAGRWRLVRQLLEESLLMSVAAGLLGMALAWGFLQLLLAFSPPDLPRLEEIAIRPAALGFTAALCLLTGLLFGLTPALQTTRPRLSESLRAGRGSRTLSGANLPSRLLIIGEVSLALLVVVGAGLLLRSFRELQRTELGFATESRITMSLGLEGSAFEAPDRHLQFTEELIPRVEALPGVASAGIINHLHLGGDLWASSVRVEGLDRHPADRPSASMRTVDPGFFRTAGIPLAGGREFTRQDRPDSPPVVIVNQTLAQELWEGDAIGRRIRQSDRWPWATVVGIVSDARQWDVTDPVKPEVYYPYSQNPVSFWATLSLMVHTSLPPASVVESIRGVVWSIDANVPVTRVRSMDEIFAGSIARQRFSMLLLGLFSVLALGLAAVGLYGVLSFVVSRRTHEIGIRMALGAPRNTILRMVMAHGMGLVALGLIIGLALALATTRFLASQLYEVAPSDPWTLAGGVVLLAAVGVMACYRPARRATRVDPITALRAE